MSDRQISVRRILVSGSERTSRSGNAAALLALLAAVYGIQYLDQIVVGLLVQPIKHDLHLSDTELGLLTGVAFSLFYVILGFPLGRLADKRNRKNIVVVSVVLFSAATAACGLAGGFASLFFARIVVAVGEAGTMPCAVSMLADRFRPSTRRLVMGIHSSGAFLGTAVGLLVLSSISGLATWRAIFWSVGAVGLILAPLVAVFGHEPSRKSHLLAEQNFLADMRKLLRNTPYVFVTLGLGVGAVAAAAAVNWVPAFLARSYELPERRIVLFLAIAWGVSATVGSITLGYVTNKVHRKGAHQPLLVLSALCLVFPLLFLLAFNTGPVILALLGILVAFFLMAGVRGPAFATVQDIVPSNLQATASAALMFSMYGIGVTLGPLATGILSDAFKAYAGSDALRYALSVVMGVSGVGAAVLFAFAAVSLKSLKHANLSGEVNR